jgi:hypothetical protein
MAGFQVFQLAGPAADVSKILYGKSRKSYQSPNAQYDNSGAIPHNAEERQYRGFKRNGGCVLGYNIIVVPNPP